MPDFLAFVRAAHFGSCLILHSIFALFFLGVIPAGASSGRSAAAGRLGRSLKRMLIGSLAVAAVSGALWLWIAIATMSGAPLSECLHADLFWMVLTQTPPGQVWLFRAGATLVFAIALFFLHGEFRLSGLQILPAYLCATCALVLTGSLAWLGHAGACGGPQQGLQLTGDILHLLAAGIWPAGLLPFAVLLARLLKANEPSALLAAGVATRRFSSLSLAAVGLLVFSGLGNSYFLVRTFHGLVATTYGHILLIKLALFVAMVGIGAWNLLQLRPRQAEREAANADDRETLTLRKVKRNVTIEIVLGTLVLIVLGVLGITAPAIHS